MNILSNFLKSVIAVIVIPPSLYAMAMAGVGAGLFYSLALLIHTLPLSIVVLLLELKKKSTEQ